MSRGKWTIVFIFGFSLVAVVVSVAWRIHETQRVLEFWGAESAELIAKADKVELIFLCPLEEGVKTPEESIIDVDGRPKMVWLGMDVSHAPGFTHARHALTLSRNLIRGGPGECTPRWNSALRFSDGEKSVVVLIDVDCRVIRRQGDPQTAIIRQQIADGLETLFNEAYEREKQWPSKDIVVPIPKGKPE